MHMEIVLCEFKISVPFVYVAFERVGVDGGADRGSEEFFVVFEEAASGGGEGDWCHFDGGGGKEEVKDWDEWL